ncbi:MAG: sulfatase-like hydrolase/transferase [Planctomycetota bacterium]
MQRQIVAVLLSILIADIAIAQQKNVVFIVVDDMKTVAGHLSEQPGSFLQTVYPDPAVRQQVVSVLTPNMDALAARGVSFSQCLCPSPLCNGSRTAVMTGLSPVITEFTSNNVNFRDSGRIELREAVTLPENLKDNGYYSLGIGKIYHHPDGPFTDAGRSWTDWIDAGIGTNGPVNFAEYYIPGSVFKFGANEFPVAEHWDYRNSDLIAKLIEGETVTRNDNDYTLPQGQPFFLACGIYRPHHPIYAPQEMVDLFDRTDMTGIDEAYLQLVTDDRDDLSARGLGHAPQGHFGALVSRGGVEGWRDLIKHYLACVAFADRCVGRIIEAVENSPHADDTIIVLWSDHGWALGEKRHLKKSAFWVESDSMLVISDPDIPRSAGAICRRPVSLMDIYPTIHSRCGVAAPPEVTGNDLTPLLRFPWFPGNLPGAPPIAVLNRDEFAMDTRRYRLIRYDEGDYELYSRHADPYYRNNLVGNPFYDKILAELLIELDEQVGD